MIAARPCLLPNHSRDPSRDHDVMIRSPESGNAVSGWNVPLLKPGGMIMENDQRTSAETRSSYAAVLEGAIETDRTAQRKPANLADLDESVRRADSGSL
jgi:hypothetical protein